MPTEQEVRLYARSDGVVPFSRWFLGLRDKQTRDRIDERISRLRLGNFGDCRPVGDGVHELRFFVGRGVRIYFGRQGNAVAILLCGGDKHSQSRDIQRAKAYWRDYRSRGHA